MAFLTTSVAGTSSSMFMRESYAPRLRCCNFPRRARDSSLGAATRFRLPKNFNFVLHDALDSLGAETTLARDARMRYRAEAEKLEESVKETSISVRGPVDLFNFALCVSAEDDALVSHSSVPLPVDSFFTRLVSLTMGYCDAYTFAFELAPDAFFETLDHYLYVNKVFRRSNPGYEVHSQALYVNSVLTHRSGSSAMLSLIYSEILKMLDLWGRLNFEYEILFPAHLSGLPRGYDKKKTIRLGKQRTMTNQELLEEILRDLKEAFWPFPRGRDGSLFLSGAHLVDRSAVANESAVQLASAKAAKHRLDRGIWTCVKFGDMRRALSASERLILLETDAKELRDYSILLYHCGFYEKSLQFLKLYRESEARGTDLEEDAARKLMVRLDLIASEVGWTKPSTQYSLGNFSDPW